MQTVVCDDCGKSRTIVRARKGQTRCMDCSGKARRKLNACTKCKKPRHSSSPVGLCRDCYDGGRRPPETYPVIYYKEQV